MSSKHALIQQQRRGIPPLIVQWLQELPDPPLGEEDADLRVARIVAVDADGNIKLEVIPGSVESHSDLVAPA